mmetsp:Transcript_1580/g.4739  ORF Transcript_1580/g.4739 Transcript_1580/m.4739 type:complete len:290 (+) Transcript_1580:313-1182(+)|eukprot:CAMPEP_0198724992 /NCGR_PEP_ID=MMETSP1475-20131203/2362_1 /TAXON_ID= ORGANISM="Unidentified sp., Strain CCMP1999" /NCGR_SAMPLE_ID=MMETSP1475 /ASSEMBLY_ACC=CAM_ASM_001111 /LENGTH=289 /DNA_ID=CAMNT_0044486653 /DNA_START=295 /DNA_END=1164 /DNA_ORIENTATION=+
MMSGAKQEREDIEAALMPQLTTPDRRRTRQTKLAERRALRGAIYTSLMLLALILLAAVEIHRQNNVALRIQEKTQFFASELKHVVENGIGSYANHPANVEVQNQTEPENPAETGPVEKDKQHPHISLQELRDDVDEFITHVEEEKSSAMVEVEKIKERRRRRKERTMQQMSSNVSDLHPETSLDEEFNDARKLLTSLRADLDPKAVLEIDALILQAVKGNYDEKTEPEGLFKTDEESLNDEIEVDQDGELWNAWKNLKGMYKSEAMRQAVAKVEDIENVVQSLDSNDES